MNGPDNCMGWVRQQDGDAVSRQYTDGDIPLIGQKGVRAAIQGAPGGRQWVIDDPYSVLMYLVHGDESLGLASNRVGH